MRRSQPIWFSLGITISSLATLLSQTPAVPYSPSTRADQPVPRSDRNSQIAHAELVKKAAQGGIDLYFVGWGMGNSTASTQGPPAPAGRQQRRPYTATVRPDGCSCRRHRRRDSGLAHRDPPKGPGRHRDSDGNDAKQHPRKHRSHADDPPVQ
ncbi:MAG: hypothetical protein U1G08_13930 [Verrucomicrobiota bacterium]